MTARVVTAFVGGYAAVAGMAALAARLAPISRPEAVVWAMILSFLIYAGLLLWAFHERRLLRVMAVIWGVAILAGGSTWLLGTAA
ncbi:hypothetical protein ACFB49_09260 [Sphingomonas sp. DBB INV C78]|uniref:iron transporter n=1 Tax=Sphingomonas sp. DBB INV C78 TaxID=3349434 RepID=UPI0036D34864